MAIRCPGSTTSVRSPFPARTQDVGGRDAGSVWGYLTDFDVIGDWFLPGFGDGFGDGWVLLGVARRSPGSCSASAAAPARPGAPARWSASLWSSPGWLRRPRLPAPPGSRTDSFPASVTWPRPWRSALALLGSGIGQRGSDGQVAGRGGDACSGAVHDCLRRWLGLQLLAGRSGAAAVFWLFCLLALGVWRVRTKQHRFSRRSTRRLLAMERRHGPGLPGPLRPSGPDATTSTTVTPHPDFTTPGLTEAFVWANGESGVQRSAPTPPASTRSGAENLDNDVQFIGVKQPHGGFIEAENCRDVRQRASTTGDYDYLVLTLDRRRPEAATSHANWPGSPPTRPSSLSASPPAEPYCRLDSLCRSRPASPATGFARGLPTVRDRSGLRLGQDAQLGILLCPAWN